MQLVQGGCLGVIAGEVLVGPPVPHLSVAANMAPMARQSCGGEGCEGGGRGQQQAAGWVSTEHQTGLHIDKVITDHQHQHLDVHSHIFQMWGCGWASHLLPRPPSQPAQPPQAPSSPPPPTTHRQLEGCEAQQGIQRGADEGPGHQRATDTRQQDGGQVGKEHRLLHAQPAVEDDRRQQVPVRGDRRRTREAEGGLGLRQGVGRWVYHPAAAAGMPCCSVHEPHTGPALGAADMTAPPVCSCVHVYELPLLLLLLPPACCCPCCPASREEAGCIEFQQLLHHAPAQGVVEQQQRQPCGQSQGAGGAALGEEGHPGVKGRLGGGGGGGEEVGV